MKIVIVDKNIDLMGGVERIINCLANYFINSNEVTVISEVKNKIEPFFEYNKKINRIYMVDETNSYTRNSTVKNFKYYFIRLREKIKEYFGIRIKNKTVQKFICDADVIIFARVNAFLDFRKYFNEMNGKRIIVRDAIHLMNFNNKEKKEMKKIFPKLVSYFIVSSDESITTYENFFGKSDIIFKKIYNPLGIECKQCGSLKSKTIVSYGRMDPQKGFDNLIKAFDLFCSYNNDWTLKIYGDGNYKKYYEDIINNCVYKKNIQLLNSEKDIINILSNASIFVMSSRFEGYANALVEAVACGVPSISYDWLMGVDEIIQNEDNGLIVSLKNREDYFKGIDCEDDVINLFNAMNRLVNDKELYLKIKKNAFKIIKTRNIEVIIKEWGKIISL